MKVGINLLIIVVLIGASITLLLDMGVLSNRWTGYLVFIMLIVAGYLIKATNWNSGA